MRIRTDLLILILISSIVVSHCNDSANNSIREALAVGNKQGAEGAQEGLNLAIQTISGATKQIEATLKSNVTEHVNNTSNSTITKEDIKSAFKMRKMN